VFSLALQSSPQRHGSAYDGLPFDLDRRLPMVEKERQADALRDSLVSVSMPKSG
jgi:hypothetical protein